MSNKRPNHQPKNKASNTTANSLQHRVEQFSGPVPHPDLLKKYDDLMPGLADRLVIMAERSIEAEIQLQNKAIIVREKEIDSRNRQEKQEHTDYRLGVLVALLVVMLFLSVAIFSIYKDAHAVAGAVIAGLAGIIWAVRRSTRSD